MKKDSVFFIFLFSLLVAVYSKPIFFHPTLNFDDTSLIGPLKEVHSLEKYKELIDQNVILDVQPVRDLSFWVELEVERLTGFRNSQALNLLLWFGALLFLNSILTKWNVSPFFRYGIIAVVSMHPVVTSSVAWTSARKHLLSLFFLAWLLHLEFNQRSKNFRSKQYVICFLMCFSQPINMLAPLLVSACDWWVNRKKKSLFEYKYVLGFVLIAGICAFVNMNYYTGDYVKQTGEILPKFLAEENQKMIFRIFVWGRSFFQLINPAAASPVPYRILKDETFMGLALLGVFILTLWFFRRKFTADRMAVALVLVASPVLMMTIKLTHHLGWDTYLLSSVWSLGLFAGSFQWPQISSRKALGVLAGIAAINGGFSFAFASKWATDHDLNEFAYRKEKIFFAQENYARQLLHENQNWTLAKELVDDLEQKSPQRITIPYLKARVVYQAPVSPQEKRQMFLDIETSHPWIQYYFAAFEASQGQVDRGYLRLKRLWLASREEIFKVTQELFPVYVSNWSKMCERAKLEDCQWIQNEVKLFTEQKSKNGKQFF